MTTGITCTSCRHALNPGPHTMLVATDDHDLVAVAIDPDTDGMHPSHGTGCPIVVGLDAAAAEAVGDGPESARLTDSQLVTWFRDREHLRRLNNGIALRTYRIIRGARS